jgi:hypothetical protein
MNLSYLPTRHQTDPIVADAIRSLGGAAQQALSDWDNKLCSRSERILAMCDDLDGVAATITGSGPGAHAVRRVCAAAGVAVAAACRSGDLVGSGAVSDDADDEVIDDAIDILLDYLGGVLHAAAVLAAVPAEQWMHTLSCDLIVVAGRGREFDDEDGWAQIAVDLTVCAARTLAAAIEGSTP